jgi:methyl-accepting chemotaxis protein
MLAKERAGIERATGSAIFTEGKFNPDRHRAFLTALAEQNLLFKEFATLSDPTFRSILAETVKGPEIDMVAKWRDVAVNLPKTGSTEGIAGPDWFAKTTVRIDQLKAVEDAIGASIGTKATALAAEARSRFWMSLAMEAAIAVLVMVLVVLVARSIARPLSRAAFAISAIAKGSTDVVLPDALSDRSEVGKISNAAGAFLTAVRERQAMERDRVAREQREVQLRMQTLAEMAQNVESATETGMRRIVDGTDVLRTKAETMTQKLTVVTGATAEVSAKAQAARTNNAEAARLSDQVIQAIGEIAEQVTSGSTVSAEAVEKARLSRETIDDLARAAVEIGSFVEMISSIANQTNLLALNATIEAARAGEAGRGFAIVASEVKALAQQTNQSTEQISAKVTQIQTRTRQAVDALAGISQSIETLSAVTTAIAAAMEEQRAATGGFASALAQSSDSAANVAAHIDAIATMARDSVSNAQDVATVAAEMLKASDALRAEIPAIVREATIKAERRQSVRVEAGLRDQVDVTLGSTTQRVQFHNVSEGGLSVRSVPGWKVGLAGRLRFHDGVEVEVSVIWVHGDEAGLGFKAPFPGAYAYAAHPVSASAA